MGIELIELVEAKWNDGLSGEVCDVYEVYSGDWVKVYSDSANGYWHTYEKWEASMSGTWPYHERAYIMVLSGERYVGHWDNIELFYNWLVIYLRAEITEKVTAEVPFYDWVERNSRAQ